MHYARDNEGPYRDSTLCTVKGHSELCSGYVSQSYECIFSDRFLLDRAYRKEPVINSKFTNVYSSL